MNLARRAAKMVHVQHSTAAPVVLRLPGNVSGATSGASRPVKVPLPGAVYNGFKFEPSTVRAGTVHVHVDQPVVSPVPAHTNILTLSFFMFYYSVLH